MSDQQAMMAEHRLTNFRLLLKCYFHPWYPMERDARPRESNSRLVETISQPSRTPMPPSPSLSSPHLPSYLTVHSSKYWTRLDSDLPEESDSTGLYHLASSTTQEDGMEFASKVHRERIVHLSAGCGRGKNRIATLSDGTKMCCRYRDVMTVETITLVINKWRKKIN